MEVFDTQQLQHLKVSHYTAGFDVLEQDGLSTTQCLDLVHDSSVSVFTAVCVQTLFEACLEICDCTGPSFPYCSL